MARGHPLLGRVLINAVASIRLFAEIQPRSLILIKFLHGQNQLRGCGSAIVCCKLWRKRHASDGQSDCARCCRCWPRRHSCGVAIWNTDSQRLRLARLNPNRYRGTHSNGARRLQLAARQLVCDSPHEQDDQHANRDVIGNFHGMASLR
jgi:hypothetical protein